MKISLLFISVLCTFSVAFAGDLEPPAAPAPTMKSLDEIPGSWSRALPAAERFELVLNDEAVLDKETGLVWERTPSGGGGSSGFHLAAQECARASTGGRFGWRLPTAAEFVSLLDPASPNAPVLLPAGHPFLSFSTASSAYSTADWYPDSTNTVPLDKIWYLEVGTNGVASLSHQGGGAAWCVRGPR